MKKDFFLVILIIISIGLSIVVFGSVEKINKIRKTLDEERYNRMVTEETLQKREAKLSTLGVQLKAAEDKMNRVQGLIVQEKDNNVSLQKQYEDLNRAKIDLEAKLKSALEEKNSLPVQEPAEAVTNNISVPTAVK